MKVCLAATAILGLMLAAPGIVHAQRAVSDAASGRYISMNAVAVSEPGLHAAPASPDAHDASTPYAASAQPAHGAGYVNPYAADYPLDDYGDAHQAYDPPAADAATSAAYGVGPYAEGGLAAKDSASRGCCSGDDHCGCDSCCRSFWEHRTGVFADFLYLAPRGVDVAYALPRDGIDPLTSVPFGEVGVARPDYSAGYRFGFNWATSRCSSFVGSYMNYQGETNDAIFVDAPLVIHSLVTHPATTSAAADSLAAQARYDIDFQLGDLAYRRLLSGGRNYAVNYSAGTRYAFMDQEFASAQPIGPGITGMASDIEFWGAGPRLGIDVRRRVRRRLFSYGEGFASVLVGEFDSDYRQFNNFQLTQTFTGWEDSRAVPVLDFELGMGWENARGNLRLRGGYYFAAWFNMVTTSEYIQAVQTSNYVDLGDTITFDGATARVEFLW